MATERTTSSGGRRSGAGGQGSAEASAQTEQGTTVQLPGVTAEVHPPSQQEITGAVNAVREVTASPMHVAYFGGLAALAAFR